MTTLPSRIARLRPTLESLLAGNIAPDKVLVVVPPYSIRENSGYSIPEFLKDRDFCGDKITVVHAERDFGPGSKLLGSIDVVPMDSYLVLADDDVRYHAGFLCGLVELQRADHGSSFSYHTFRVRGFTVGQGCDGFSFWRPNLDGVQDFARRHIVETNLLFHDDLWISYFLTAKGLKIREVPKPDHTRLIYEIEHHVNALSQLTGELSRRTLNHTGLKRLMREAPLPWRLRQEIRLISAFDRIWYRPTRKLARFFGR